MNAHASRLANTCLALAILALMLLPLSAFGARLAWLDVQVALLLFAAAGLTGLIVITTAGLTTRRQHNPASRSRLGVAAALALPPVIFFALNIFAGAGAPLIHDITTAPDDPPAFLAGIHERGPDSNPLRYTAETARLQREAYPDLAPLETQLNAGEAFALAEQIATEMGWDIYFSDAQEGRIEAVDTTRWFRFRDDIVIRIRPTASGAILDLRSTSRVGQGDLGVNARRIKQFIDRFQKVAS